MASARSRATARESEFAGGTRSPARKLRSVLTPYALLVPAAAFLIVFVAYPIYYAGSLSMYNYRVGAEAAARYVGFENYVSALSDPRLVGSLVRTAIFVSGSVGGTMLTGFALALTLWSQGERFAETWLRPIFLLPVLASPVIIGLVWKWVLDPTFGVVAMLLQMVAIKSPVWFGSPGLAIGTVIAVDIWQFTPFVFLTCLAGLKSLDSEVLEAAMVDGAGGWSMLWRVILPMMRPLLTVILLLRMFMALRTFDVIYILTNGGPGRATEVLNMYVYNIGFGFFRAGYGSALTLIIVVISFAVALVLLRVVRSPLMEDA